MAVECTYCEERINAKRGIYIRCTACEDVNLCLECYSSGAIIAEHLNDHPYELIDCGSFPILDESWKAHEELALLEAIETFGIGSWTEIAKAVETRTAEECKNRYLTVYVENFFGRRTWNAVKKDVYHIHDHTCLQNRPLSPSLSMPEKNKVVDISREQQLRLGYMPRRDDFEREYDNDAELLVSKLAVNANDDTELDQELKIAHINIYTDRLRERFRRKRVTLEYNLVKLFFHMHPEESGKHENETISQYNENPSSSPTDRHNIQTDSELTLSLDKKQTCHRLSTVQTEVIKPATSNGSCQNSILNYFTKIDPTKKGDSIKVESQQQIQQQSSSKQEDKNYSILSSYFKDLNKTFAEKDFTTLEEKLRIFCQFSPAETHNQLIKNLARERELKVRIKELIKRRKKGLKKSTNIKTTDNVDCIEDSDASMQLHEKYPTKISPQQDQSMEVDDDQNSIVTPTKVNLKKNGHNNTPKNQSNKAINAIPYSPDNDSGWRLLTDTERRLCKTLNLKPSQYISFKAFLMKVSPF